MSPPPPEGTIDGRDPLRAGRGATSTTPTHLAPRWLATYCSLAGLSDAITGLLLVTAPAFTLTLMGITAPITVSSIELTYVRFVGVFVGSVGLSYLYPFLAHPAQRLRRWRVVLEVTTLVRCAVALFVAVTLVQGALVLAWVSVPLTDVLLAALQLLILRRLGAHHEA